MNDADLVKKCRKGDREAFSTLVGKYAKPMTTMILRLVRDEEEAKDISQTALLRAYQGLPRFMMASSFKTWLYSIAINAAKDYLRRRRPTPDSDMIDATADSFVSLDRRIDVKRNRDRLRRAIEELPEKQRLTLQLRVYEEMDYREIARILGGSTGSARGNFFQAVKSLRERLGSADEQI